MKKFDGINIQFPISSLIATGQKTIETRTYPISNKYLNKELILIETPGSTGKFQARAIAIIKITQSFKYSSKKEFYDDFHKHFVTADSPWAWEKKPKYGWVIEVIKKLQPPVLITTSKGIVYRKNITLDC